jgi:hypothetical protein
MLNLCHHRHQYHVLTVSLCHHSYQYHTLRSVCVTTTTRTTFQRSVSDITQTGITSLCERHTVKCKAIPLQPLTSPEGSRRLRLPDFKKIGTRKWHVCQPYASAAFTPVNIHGTHFCQRQSQPSATGRIMSIKNPVSQSGIETTTFRFVAQCLNHCATACPRTSLSVLTKPIYYNLLQTLVLW